MVQAAVAPENYEQLRVAARGIRRPVVPERLLQERRGRRRERLRVQYNQSGERIVQTLNSAGKTRLRTIQRRGAHERGPYRIL